MISTNIIIYQIFKINNKKKQMGGEERERGNRD
jgi:hypothetical protein